MNGMIKTTAACLLLLSGLAACQSNGGSIGMGPPLQPALSGEAPAFNASVHTIDPAPESAKNTDIPVDGSKMVTAYDRYAKGEIIAPEEVITSDVGQ
jgi:hypothetical protein